MTQGDCSPLCGEFMTIDRGPFRSVDGTAEGKVITSSFFLVSMPMLKHYT
ncbi:hypothetical protein [Ancylobacter radicis]|uniref:Uncharacterized protein n=1 Tax=Ancylobacter radicis TaxID=2836179 RepID=A0ABS5R6F9_9HYPH|nr:hypothetical protein [Ancylobacter radicis]MBS9476777.1 hypothetical protein [Ancylobacter radicis]